MENGLTISADKNYESIVDANQRRFNSAIEAFEKVKELAKYLSESETFTKGFEKKDKNGNPILDENGKPTINEQDIAICLMAGRDLGLDPAGSLLLGTKLNQKTYLSILKGRALGLDPTTAMEKIVSIPTKAGLISYTMVDIITAKLNQGGVKFLPFIKNYAPNYIYYSLGGKELIDIDVIYNDNDEINDNFFLVDSLTKGDKVQEAIQAGKVCVTRVQQGFYSKAIFIRSFKDGSTSKHIQRFSTLDAERAGYLPTYDVSGKMINDARTPGGPWITNTPQMMNNRIISIGGRIIGADLIHGIYSEEEAKDIIDVNHEEVK